LLVGVVLQGSSCAGARKLVSSQEALLQVAGKVLILLEAAVSGCAKTIHGSNVQKTWLLQATAIMLEDGTETVMCWEATFQSQRIRANTPKPTQSFQLGGNA
jgi:hypothetical protein